MKGKYHVIVQNNKLRYEFDVKRNITIIQGDSATGKTTLIQMITLHTNQGESSGISIQCKKNCRSIPEADWKIILPLLHDQIIFIDENNSFLRTQEFAEAVKASDNYFVLVTRESLPNLPYSVEEIYGIHVSGKYRDLKRTYNEFYKIYDLSSSQDIYPANIITEDSHSGYDFFHAVCNKAGIPCSSANGKSNIIKVLSSVREADTLIIADGAAIGSEMAELFLLLKENSSIHLYLPESFEWLILASGLIDGAQIKDILNHPEDFIESQNFFSWEQYFTWLLTDQSQNTYLKYSKTALNPNYLHEKEVSAVLKVMPHIHILDR